MKDIYNFKNIVLALIVIPSLITANNSVFQMTKCDTVVDPTWTLIANLTVSDSLQCARACYINSTCEHVSYYRDTCMLWEGEVTCDIDSEEPWEVYMVRARCGAGWYHYRGSCYLPVGSPSTWVASQDHCSSLGAHLLTTRSLDETAFIVDLISSLYPSWNNIWIGASNTLAGGAWEWVTGEPWDFEDWKYDQPTGEWLGIPESCVEMTVSTSEQRWNDAFCDYAYYCSYNFVCEKDLPVTRLSLHSKFFANTVYKFRTRL